MKLACKESVCRTRPMNLTEKDDLLFEAEYFKSFDEVESIRLGNVLILSNGVIIKRRILTEVFLCQKKIPVFRLLKLYLKSAWCLLKSRNTVKISKGLLLTDHFSDGFFHWLGDVLQKLEALDDKAIDISQYVLLIPSTCAHDYIYETLRAYKVRYLVIDVSSRVQVEDLLYVPEVTPTGNYRLELMRSMRGRFIDYFQANTGNKRVYITRKKARKRKIINENVLIPILKKYNFQVIAMEDLVFKEQFKLVAEANVLVSLHGAGLTHMLWLGSNKETKGKVLEIRAEGDTTNNCFYTLASDLNLDYYYCLADKVNNKSTQLTDFKINPLKLEQTLVQMLGSLDEV